MLKDKIEADNIGQSEERLVDGILQQEGIGQDKIRYDRFGWKYQVRSICQGKDRKGQDGGIR